MYAALAFIAFLLLAVIGWGIGEARYHNFHYTEDKPHHPDPTARPEDAPELSLRDILKENSTRGYSAV